MDVPVLNGISNKVELDADVASSKRVLGSGRDGHTCLIVFTNGGRAINRMSELSEKHAQVNGLCSGKAQCDVLGFGCGFCHGGLQRLR